MNTTDPTPIRVLIVDDHQMFLDGLKMLLSGLDFLDLAGEANDGAAALNYLRQHEVDLLITDYNMPGMSGLELTEAVKAEFPDVKVLVLTMYNDRSIIEAILMAEADGYILKRTGREELTRAIRTIHDHGTFYSNEVMAIMMDNIRREKKTVPQQEALSPREEEVLQLICQEFSSTEIAEKLFISKHTVDSHRKSIIQKTQAKSIVGLIKYAIVNDIVSFD